MLKLYGIIFIPNPSLLSSNSTIVYSIALNQRIETTNNLADYYPSLPSFDNNDLLIHDEFSQKAFIPGKAIRAYSLEHSPAAGYHNIFINNTTQYYKNLPYQVIDSKGNRSQFNYSGDVSVKRFQNDTLKETLAYNIAGTGFAPSQMKSFLPDGSAIEYTVRFDPINGNPLYVVNHNGIGIGYRYDKSNRIQSISSSRLYDPNGFEYTANDYSLPKLTVYEEEINYEPDLPYLTRSGVIEIVNQANSPLVGQTKKDKLINNFVYDDFGHKIDIISNSVEKYYDRFATLDISSVYHNDDRFTFIDSITISFDASVYTDDDLGLKNL